MMKVALHGAEFYAYHGYYPEEQLLGNRFVMDMEAAFVAGGDVEDSLTNTLNYEQLYCIAEAEMQEPKKLLETVAQGVLDRIRADFPFVINATVRLKKLHPPLKGKVAWSSVEVSF